MSADHSEFMGSHLKPVSVHAITETRLLPTKTQRLIAFLRERFARAS
jgi:hypothetical protein